MITFRRWPLRNEAADTGTDTGGTDTAVADDKTPAADEIPPEIIAEAQKMGWTPKDQFRGDPDKWRPADEFVERGRTMLPLLHSKVKRQERQISELMTTVKDFTEHLSKTEKRAYDKAMSDLKEARAAAVKAGDGATFDKVDEAIVELRDQIKAKEARSTNEQQPSQIDPKEFETWLERNKWANDKTLQNVGYAIREELAEQHPDAGPIELLDLVAKEVKKRFPEKFENPRRNAAPSVEGSAPPRRSGGKSYADLPSEARAACDRMARNGYASDPKAMAEFKANYVKQYFSE